MNSHSPEFVTITPDKNGAPSPFLQLPSARDDIAPSTSLRHMSTIEMLTTAIKYNKLDQASGGSVDTEVEDDVVRLIVPESHRWKRVLIRLEILRDEMWRVLSRQVPRTLDQNRIGIQMTVALLLSTIPLYIKPVSAQLQGAGVYLAINAVNMYEGTHGGTFSKGADRTVATLISYVYAMMVYLPVYLKGYRRLSEHGWLRWSFYASAVFATSLWAFVRYHFGLEHSPLVYGGLSTSLGLHAMVTERWFESMARIIGTSLAGIFIGTLVFRYVIPQSAATCAQTDLANSLRMISHSLEPLLAFESGLIESSSFLEKSTLLRAVSKRSTLYKDDGDTILPRRRSNKSQTRAAFQQREVDFRTFEIFRDKVWDNVEATYKLLRRQDLLLRNARKELYSKTPHRFPAEAYAALLKSVKRLFFSATALYLSLDTRSAAFSAPSDQDLFGDTWRFCGALKILPKEESEVTLTNIGQAHTHPGGFHSLLSKPIAELSALRAKFASDPRLRDIGPTIGVTPRERPHIHISPRDETSPIQTSAPATAADIDNLREVLAPTRLRQQSLRPSMKQALLSVDDPSASRMSQDKRLRSSLSGSSTSMVGILRMPQLSFRLETSPGESCKATGAQVDELAAVCQWVSVYGPLIGRVSRHVSTAIESVARSLEKRRLCGSVQESLLLAEDAVTDFSRQRKNLQFSLQALCDGILVAQTGGEKADVADGLLMQWMGIGLTDYAALTTEQTKHVWETFQSMQDRLATTRASIFGLTAELQGVTDTLRTFMRAMNYPTEDRHAKTM